MDFSEWLRAQRTGRRWSQAELAQRAGLAQTYISKLEDPQKRTRLGLDAARGLAAALGVPFEELMLVAAGPDGDGVGPDDLTDLLARGRALGWSRALLDAIERQAQTGQMPESERQALLRDLRQDIEDAERRAATGAPALPAPPEAQVQARQAGLVGGDSGAHTRPAPGRYAYGRPAMLDERGRGISEGRGPAYQPVRIEGG